MIIDQKSKNIALHYSLVLSKIANLTNVTPFGIKTTFDYRSKKSKRRVFSKKATIERRGGAFVGVGSRALVAPLGSKMTIDYPPKKSK